VGGGRLILTTPEPLADRVIRWETTYENTDRAWEAFTSAFALWMLDKPARR
jgi:hypothetical protein